MLSTSPNTCRMALGWECHYLRGLKETEGNMNVLVELVTQRAVDAPCRANCFNLAKQFPVDR